MSEAKNEKGQPKALSALQLVEQAQQGLESLKSVKADGTVAGSAEFKAVFDSLRELHKTLSGKPKGAGTPQPPKVVNTPNTSGGTTDAKSSESGGAPATPTEAPPKQ